VTGRDLLDKLVAQESSRVLAVVEQVLGLGR